MKQYTQRGFIKIYIANGFHYSRHNGDHAIYINDNGKHISIPNHLESVIAKRLIKENNLEANIKKAKELKKLREMGVLDDNLPVGSDTSDAPWNQDDIMERELEVLVSVTLSKTFKIKVRDYISVDVNRDEDGNYYEDIDCSSCDLKTAVEEQIVLPQEAYKYVTSSNNESIKEDLKGWNIDDFEVVQE